MLKSMRGIAVDHPLKRIRESLKETPEELGLRGFSSSQGFASWLGRSSSLIRNVECGIKPNWEKLAKLVESKTGVGFEWMMSSPSPTEPIMDVDGKPWSAAERLDPLAGVNGAPNWRILLKTSPVSVVRLAVIMTETMMTAQYLTKNSLGHQSTDSTGFFAGLLKLLETSGAFSDSHFMATINKALNEETPVIMGRMMTQLISKKPENSDHDVIVSGKTRIILD